MQSIKKNSNLKNPKVGIQKKKKELKTANKTSTAVDVLLHDTPTDFHDTPTDFHDTPTDFHDTPTDY